MNADAAAPILLSMRNIHVAYGATRALNGVDFDLYRGEIHALVGEHRAGKSSLVKLMSGAERRKAGEIMLEGRRLGHLTPDGARRLGIGMVYQNLSVIPDLNAVENVFAGQMIHKPYLVLDHGEMLRRTREIFDRIGFSVDCHVPLRRLSAVQCHMVEFARSLLTEPRILILDELSNKLTPVEMKKIYRILLELRERSCGVIYISHDIDEVLKLADRVTILKGGFRRETAPVRNLDRFRLFQLTYSFSLDQQQLEYGETRFALLKRYLDSVIQNVPVGVLLLDPDANIQLVNYAAVDILEFRHQAVAGRPISEVVRLDPDARVELVEAVRTGVLRTWDELAYGEGKLVKLDAYPLLDEEGGCIGATIIAQDVSMTKSLNDYLIQSEKMASVAEVAVGVAHEINNPLFIIQNYVELIKGRLGDDDAREKIGKIESELERIVEIITGLLSFSRIKNLPERLVNLRGTLEDVLVLLRHPLAEKRIVVEKRYPERDILVVGDENRLKQVFINIISNSIDAVLDAGSIGIALERQPAGDWAVASIRDDGSGIPDDVADKVFNPFFSTKISKKNTGLGLSISRHIVEEHQGTIGFRSIPGRSTTFTVRLPLRE